MSGEPTTQMLGLETLTKELTSAVSAATALKSEQEGQFRNLQNFMEETKKADMARAAKLEEESKKYAQMCNDMQVLQETQKQIKKQLDTPLMSGSSRDMRDNDRKCALLFQERSFYRRGGDKADFKADNDNLINIDDYRAVVAGLSKLGLQDYQTIRKNFTEAQENIFRAMGGLDLGVSFFLPEALGIEVDCNPECGYLLDLYGQVTVSKSAFSFIQIKDYGKLGAYVCDAICDGPVGEDGNVVMQLGETSDYRGVLCFSIQTLRQANYPILPFMFRAAQRSYRINRNRELMIGGADGDKMNKTVGWAFGSGSFPVYKTSQAQALAPEDVRTFIHSVPREYGDVTTIMHQNVMALISTMKDKNGRFMFGDGALDFSPENVMKNFRISNCLPDPTYKLTKSSTALVSGDFIMAAANWRTAYYAVTEEPLTITQWPAGSGKWCVKYQFGARDGGFLGCSEAGRILRVA